MSPRDAVYSWQQGWYLLCIARNHQPGIHTVDFRLHDASTTTHLTNPPPFLPPCHSCPQVTLYTRGKKAITEQIADDTDYSYQQFSRSIKHIKGDRQVGRQQVAGVGCGPAYESTSMSGRGCRRGEGCRRVVCARHAGSSTWLGRRAVEH
jgi:hypothetical protein